MQISPIYYAYESVSRRLDISVRNHRWLISQCGDLPSSAKN